MGELVGYAETMANANSESCAEMGPAYFGAASLLNAEREMDTDEELRAAARTDNHAFDRLYEAYVDDVQKYATLVMGNEAGANDATEQAFMTTLRSLQQETDDPGAPFHVIMFRHAAAATTHKSNFLQRLARQCDPRWRAASKKTLLPPHWSSFDIDDRRILALIYHVCYPPELVADILGADLDYVKDVVTMAKERLGFAPVTISAYSAGPEPSEDDSFSST